MTRIILGAVWVASLVAAFLVGRENLEERVVLSPETPSDMSAAIRSALSLGSPVERMDQSAAVLQQLNGENLEEVLEVYESMLSTLSDIEIVMFVDTWAGIDPRSAVDRTMAWKFPSKRVTGSNAAIQSWARRKPIEARAAVAELVVDYPMLRNRILDNFLIGWANSGQAGLAEYMARMDTNVPERFSAQVINALLRRGGHEAVAEFVQEVVTSPNYEKPFKQAVFRSGTRSSARWEPAWVAERTLSYLGNPWSQDGPRLVGEQWGKHDGPAALAWAENLEDGVPREEATRAAFISWWKEEPKAATAWLMTEDRSAFHDPALSFYARNLAEREPTEAIALCETLYNEATRLNCLRKSAAEWYALDALAAEEWLQDSPIDEEARDKIRQPTKLRSREGPGSARARRMGGAPARRD